MRIVYHSFFWAILFVLLFLWEGTAFGLYFSFTNELINLCFYIIIVYFNLNYLIPHYLYEDKIWTYLGLLLLATLVLTPIKLIIFYFKFADYPSLQNGLVAHQWSQFLLTFFITSSATVGKIISDWTKDRRERQELKTKTIQSELKFLKTQINPHFLFNTLNSLYALTLKKSDNAPQIVIQLSEMMRYMLYECNESSVLLSNEVKYIQNYLALERLRQGPGIEINFQVQGDINGKMIAPLLFTPFLENSFKHGLSNQIKEGYVNILLEAEENEISFFIENSKPSTIPMKSHSRSGGIGLTNLRRRLKILYPNRHKLEINNTPNSYSVHLVIMSV
ncbi:MAG TPA: histidine kinase [Saprospiraceae bacterium]|nr:histidine kinase [Saprospiraceae bacterium]